MSNWDRLDALDLAGAIDGYRKSAAVHLDEDHPLLRLRAEAANAGKTTSTNAFDVNRLKSKLRQICTFTKLCKSECAANEAQGCRLLGNVGC